MRQLIYLGVLAALMGWLSGCESPLGETTYPKAVLDEYEGTWEAHDESLRRPEGASQVRLFVDIVRGEHRVAPADGHIQGSRRDRYYVTARFEGSTKDMKELPKSMEIEGEFIRSSRWTLFTFQPGIGEQWAWESLVLWTPLQQTLRIEQDGADLLVYAPRVQLVYTPAKMAGTLEFQPPARAEPGKSEARLLVQKMDDVFAALDKAEAEDWSDPVRLVRVK